MTAPAPAPPLTCTSCGAPLMPGPRGGLAQNYYCTNRGECREGFNITIWHGHVIAVEAIGTVDDARFRMYQPVHPMCERCGWRKGGADSWDGVRCKCGNSAPPIERVTP